MTSNSDKNRSQNNNGKQKDLWANQQINVPKKCTRNPSSRSDRKTDSVISSDSDIRFTRRKLGDTQKCGCAVIAGLLIFMLFATIAMYFGYVLLKYDSLPERIFRAKLRITAGDNWTTELADQSSLRFQHRAKYYQHAIDGMINRSDLKEGYKRSEVLALDGDEDRSDMIIHLNLNFDPYLALVSSADLLSVFIEQIGQQMVPEFANLTIDLSSLDINEVTGFMGDEPSTNASPLRPDETSDAPKEHKPQRRCEAVKLDYCQNIGYNVTTYPNLLGHKNIDEVKADLIAFREIVDSECYRQAYDFVCRLLQPPCKYRDPFEPEIGPICREYCQDFQKSCGSRITNHFKSFFDCERFPESIGSQSCHSKPNCIEDLQAKALSNRLCDGIPDCPDLSDEFKCSYCALDSLYCGRGRSCIPKSARCDGKIDCPDGLDERDCLSIAPLLSELNDPKPLTPQQVKFNSEGFAIFSEKGESGKLCAEGLESPSDKHIQRTVSESLCKALGYEKVAFSEVRNDTEPNTRYVRVLDPKAAEISFVRTTCEKKQALYVSCSNLECGFQSVLSANSAASLSKMAAPGDWPWYVSLHRDETHVCDGTLVSENWVLTTESCFQGQSKATWIAVLGNIRLNANTPWSQRRRIIGMIKSPVEGSTAALIRLETPVVFNDFIRPICLPDALNIKNYVSAQTNMSDAEKPTADTLSRSKKDEKYESNLPENRDYFFGPEDVHGEEIEDDLVRRIRAIPPEFYSSSVAPPLEVNGTTPQGRNMVVDDPAATQWTTCNTLGWSRQRDHLQRVQLKLSHMASCENISIATVNSMCTEAAFHKQDCTEEEYSGSPVMCLLPNSNRWALVGVSSWRIACQPNGIERPRMYDKITPNSAWIRHTINST
ncbi:uncharacterized protein LOC129566301 [Sitodiplosis mosellana]|uniref:uncharacterized protein LOC129566301 n=1 Tax=Sitodiplosis mosellana TaxID=263140 RepID=UPI002443A630|nr:uncharacterized protein LOC129566301 [Sitodiplosis mosellana]XP_055298075.1 uncharacterized protein LOC129566301 [Sitodiplosis mosellana]